MSESGGMEEVKTGLWVYILPLIIGFLFFIWKDNKSKSDKKLSSVPKENLARQLINDNPEMGKN